MKIHKDLLTHDGVVATTAGKVLDLGFNGDFDRKQLEWNTIFVHITAKSTGTDLTCKVYSKQENITTSPILVNDSNLLGTVVIPQATVRAGGVVAIPMPKNLKRYFTLGFTGTVVPDITAGITDEVDTDLNFNWTNYKASTGTTEVAGRATRVGNVVSGNIESRVKALEDA